MQLTGLEANIPLLFMATSELPYEHLPDEVSIANVLFKIFTKSYIFSDTRHIFGVS